MRLCFNMFLCVFAAISLTHSSLFLTFPLPTHQPPTNSSVAACSENSITNANIHGIYSFSSEWFLAKHINFGVWLVQYLLGFPLKILYVFQNTLVVNQHGDHNSQIRRVVPLNKLNFWNHPSCDHHFLGSVVQKTIQVQHIYLFVGAQVVHHSQRRLYWSVVLTGVYKLAKGICNN